MIFDVSTCHRSLKFCNNMNKITIAAAVTMCIAVFLLFLPTDKNGLVKGEKADLTVFDSTRHEFTFVNFWASYDSRSREENIRFSECVSKDGISDSLFSVSVSLDEFNSLYNDVRQRDNLKFNRNIVLLDGFDSDIAVNFMLNGKFRNYLFNSDSKLIAKDINPEQLAGIVSAYRD